MNAEQHTEDWDALLKRLRDKRLRIAAFNNKFGPRGTYLTNIGIVASAAATLLTAGPALGGLRLTQALGSAGENSPSWRILCAAAALFSLAATVATNLFRTHDIAARLARAQACDAKLESLELLAELKQLTLKDATVRFEKCLQEMALIPPDAEPGPGAQRESALDRVEGSIRDPVRSSQVDTTFACAGHAFGLQPGLHLWLAVEIDGRLWPKEGEVSVREDGSWRKTIFEEGAPGEFALSLWVMTARADRSVRKWLERGDSQGDYSELHRMAGMQRLARVHGLQRVRAA